MKDQSEFKYLNNYFTNHEDQAFHFTDDELAEIIYIARKEHANMNNVGFRSERIAFNKREQAFHDHWKKINKPESSINNGNGILQDLFIDAPMTAATPSKVIHKITTIERRIVATVIQWLGSNIGFSFLEDSLKQCGYKISPIKENESRIVLNDEEELTDRNTKVVAAFMEHCKENGIEIPDKMFEEYFGA